MRKNTIAAHIRQGKPTAYTYRGKRLISKIDLLEFLVVATDEPAIWAGKIKKRREVLGWYYIKQNYIF